MLKRTGSSSCAKEKDAQNKHRIRPNNEMCIIEESFWSAMARHRFVSEGEDKAQASLRTPREGVGKGWGRMWRTRRKSGRSRFCNI
jgi:hypothetical protein